MIDYGRFEALTFDCYGTLIDWETGIVAAARALLGAALAHRSVEELLAAFAAVEHEAEVAHQRCREVLASCSLRLGVRFGGPVDDLAAGAFARPVGRGP